MIWLAMLCACVGGDPDSNCYETSFFLLHEDHHTSGRFEVGRDADYEETRRLVGLCRPDVIQIHAKGNPGWTTYPSRIGHTPPRLARDVLGIWRDVARREGYRFSVYFNLGRDGEIMKRHPEWNRSKADGSLWDRALCYHSGVAEAYLWPMIDEIIEGYEPDGFWFDGSCFTVYVCYCDACKQRFADEHQRPLPKSPSDPMWSGFKEMEREIYRECLQETARRIHRQRPNCLVAVNWAYSLRMPERPPEGIHYLTGDIGNRVEGLSPEAHWYDGQQVPFDLMTQLNTRYRVAANDRTDRFRFGPKPAVQLEQEMAVVIANGGRFFVWDSPTPESGLTEERFLAMRDVVAPFLRERQNWCQNSERIPDVSLLHSATSHYAVTDSLHTCFTRNDNRIDGATTALARLHLNYEMVGTWRLLEQDVRSPLLIVEHPKKLTRAECSAIEQFVRQGGRVLLTGMAIGLDQRLRDMLGIVSWEGPKSDEELVWSAGGQDLTFRHWLFRAEFDDCDTLISLRDRAGASRPLLLAKTHGQGVAYYVAVPLLTSHGRNIVPSSLTKAVFEKVVPVKTRRVSTDAPGTVEVVLRRQKESETLVAHLVNMATGDREVVTSGGRKYTTISRLPPVAPCRLLVRTDEQPREIRLQPQDMVCPQWSYEAGYVRVHVPAFDVHQIITIR